MNKITTIIAITLLILFSGCKKKKIELSQSEMLVGEWIQNFGTNGDLFVREYTESGLYTISIERDGFSWVQRQGTYSTTGDVIEYNNSNTTTFLVFNDTLYLNSDEWTRR